MLAFCSIIFRRAKAKRKSSKQSTNFVWIWKFRVHACARVLVNCLASKWFTFWNGSQSDQMKFVVLLLAMPAAMCTIHITSGRWHFHQYQNHRYTIFRYPKRVFPHSRCCIYRTPTTIRTMLRARTPIATNRSAVDWPTVARIHRKTRLANGETIANVIRPNAPLTTCSNISPKHTRWVQADCVCRSFSIRILFCCGENCLMLHFRTLITLFGQVI